MYFYLTQKMENLKERSLVLTKNTKIKLISKIENINKQGKISLIFSLN
jgi:hypothetical protein